MKKVILLILFAIFVSSCQKKVELGAITLGATYNKTIQSLEREDVRIERKDNGSIIGGGEIYVLDMCFDNAICVFENDELTKVSLFRKFSTLSDASIQTFKRKMEALCGDGFYDTDEMVACYGTEKDNNGCIGAIKVEWNKTDDVFYTTIKLAK